ncbi:hypothetical protein HJC23_003219 [Cyclotella cryptica]|uniref:RRM domain-containing protein n=1 Tax=Cyclotella cryptica TaxID=29204 RepID=A0ABD3PDZ5_9STRA|eukprot:CCRYP_015475-RA/>CCRYP_015475-RA protein AED:0.41 eAED:0.41 QI:0/-1/0/1/-1/1/1/0/292
MASAVDSDEDDDLLLAAGQWASGQQSDEDDLIAGQPEKAFERSDGMKKKRKKKVPTESSDEQNAQHNVQTKEGPPETETKTFSLHLTKVPYDESQSSIRYAFSEKGCHVTSVRLVYDTDHQTGERNFRGVAFVDLADEASFQLGLKLHNTTFLGTNRKVNVRPTKTRSELSEIVRKTEERVASLIARSKLAASESKKRLREGDGDGNVDTKKKKRKHNNKRSDEKTQTKKADSEKRDSEGGGTKKHKRKSKKPGSAKESKSEETSSIKLTKKQRAKKAAVIRKLASRPKQKK